MTFLSLARARWWMVLLCVALVSAFAPEPAHATPGTFVIDASFGGPGAVSPDGMVDVPAGGSQTFTFTPTSCNIVGDVTVDDVVVGNGITSYTFTNVQSDHVLYVQFGAQSPTTTLNVFPNPALCGRPDTLVAQVPGGDGGVVKFFSNATLLGTVNVTGGVAKLILFPGRTAGTYSFSASFLGNGCANPSDSPVVSYVVPDASGETISMTLFALPDHALTSTANFLINATVLVNGILATGLQGTVTFYEGFQQFESSPVVQGHAVKNIYIPSAGFHNITAQLVVASSCFAPVVSPPVTVEVRDFSQGGSTSLALAATPNPAPVGGTTVLRATVSNGFAGGPVHFISLPDSTELGSVPLVGGQASISLGPLSLGVRTFLARYDGDGWFTGSTSSQLVLLTVAIIPTSSTVSVTPSYGVLQSPVELSAIASPANAGGLFQITAPYLGTADYYPVNGEVHTTMGLYGPPGPNVFSVHFTGNPFFGPSDASTVAYAFGHSATTVLTLDAFHPKAGDLLNFKATINAASPGGSVTFYVDNAPAGVVTVTGGQATLITNALSPGSHTVFAAWSGESYLASNPVTVLLTGATVTQFAMAAVPSPGLPRRGSSFSVKATITPPEVLGSVAFSNSAGQSSTSLLLSGVATTSTLLFNSGYYTYRVTFPGDGVYAYASDSIIVEVDAATPRLLLFSDVNPSAVGQRVTFTARLDTLPLGGTATLYIDGVPADSALVTDGTYSYSTAGLSEGEHAIDLRYSGAPLQISPALGQTVGTTEVAPGLRVLSPNGYETLVVGSRVTIRWDPYDAGLVPVVDVVIARQGGDDYEILGEGVPNTGSFEWPVTGPGVSGAFAGNRLARVAILDQSGNIGSDQSDATFWLVNAGTLEVSAAAEAEFALGPVTPNPMTGSAHFDFRVAHAANVKLSVIDLQGRELAVIAEGNQSAGAHRAQWDGRDARGPVAAGVYFVRYETPAQTMMTRFAVVR